MYPSPYSLTKDNIYEISFRLLSTALLLVGPTSRGSPDVPQVEEELLQVMAEEPLEDRQDEGVDMEEMWIHYALLDLAYYLRSHKFNDYDRRVDLIVKDFLYSVSYLEEQKEVFPWRTSRDNRYSRDPKKAAREFYKRFPDPPLRNFHWEAEQHCSQGFMECLRYSVQFTNVAMLQKDSDPHYIIPFKRWSPVKNKEDIAKANRECQRMFKEDFLGPVSFVGPIQRLQWRTTMSFYMCLFTLQEQPELSVFGEPCNNYANCLPTGQIEYNDDPRCDDTIPYNCAKYSFCPDPCCPVKKVSSMTECTQHESNPCPMDSPNRTCVLEQSLNMDIKELSKNRWNLTCKCKEDGFRWESRFGLCVDTNECEEDTDNCEDGPDTCMNVRGSFRCTCSFGYVWDGQRGLCVPMKKIIEHMENANLILRHNKTAPEKKKGKRGYLKKLFFGSKEDDEKEQDTENPGSGSQADINSRPLLVLVFILFYCIH